MPFFHLIILKEGKWESQEKKKQQTTCLSHFSKNRIPPYNDTTYYQEFKLIKRSFENIDFQVSGGKYEQNKDHFSFSMFPPSVIKSDEVLFLGYGIETDQYNDYKQDVEGRVIMILQ